eukprot:TRINITY_DN4703_c0_g1_i1.p1 TRINITY_DN4703_c0_g1~~TRINITY_DN4703_c0_g1_i1.p1  ORF type:complete len:613 (-),score=177.91 TRINITY_DN4703_c0_g1_i1:875-2713(-)
MVVSSDYSRGSSPPSGSSSFFSSFGSSEASRRHFKSSFSAPLSMSEPSGYLDAGEAHHHSYDNSAAIRPFMKPSSSYEQQQRPFSSNPQNNTYNKRGGRFMHHARGHNNNTRGKNYPQAFKKRPFNGGSQRGVAGGSGGELKPQHMASSSSVGTPSLPPPLPSPPPPSQLELDESEAERNRVSALKRLGPKLSVTDRLWMKKNKKQRMNEDKNEKKSSQNADPTKKSTKANGGAPKPMGKNADIDPLTKVICPHCGVTGSKEKYNKHITGATHANAVKQLKYRLMITLNNMRSRQKAAVEKMESVKEGSSSSTEGTFCKTCKIIHHSEPPEEHNKSELHKCIEKFLKPKCGFCKASFTSPMGFESHNASFAHLVRAGSTKDNDETEEPMDFNFEDLVTVDEVGTVDGSSGDLKEDEGPKEEEKESAAPEKTSTAPSAALVSKTTSSTTPPTPNPKTKKAPLSNKKSLNKSKKSSPKKPIEAPSVKDSSSPQEKKKGDETNEDVELKPILPTNVVIIAEEHEEGGEEAKKAVIQPDPKVPLGSTLVRRVEVLFCDVCMEFLPEESVQLFDEQIQMHCKSSKHQLAYIDMKSKMDSTEFNFNEDELDFEPEDDE